MRIEHVALNVSDPRAMADWYCRNLGFRIVSAVAGPPWTRFIADDAGTMLEIYHSPRAPVPDYGRQDMLVVHVAYLSMAIADDRRRLEGAGAVYAEGDVDSEGYGVVTLRDPWGIPVQLCRRRPV